VGGRVSSQRLAWGKFVAVWVTFLLLHFSYEAFPTTLFRLIGEQGETTFFHMKMLFVAYVFVSLIELLVRRASVGSVSLFVYSRALIAVAYPWLTITLWFTAEALGLAMPNLTVELIYANVATAVGIYVALRLEEVFGVIEFRPSLKAMTIVLFTCAVISYASFSFKVPLPFFTTPPGF